jgi:hypothetical protein
MVLSCYIQRGNNYINSDLNRTVVFIENVGHVICDDKIIYLYIRHTIFKKNMINPKIC